MKNGYAYNVITSKTGTTIYAYILKNYAMMETSVRLTGRTKDGYKIPGKNIKMTKLYKDRNCLDYLIDTLDGLTQSEVNRVREILLDEDAHRQVIEEGEAAKINEFHPLIVEYIQDHEKEESGIFIENGYGFIPSKDMETVIHGLKGCGNIKKEDFVEELMMQGLLMTNGNRNSLVKAVGKERRRYYCIKMNSEGKGVA